MASVDLSVNFPKKPCFKILSVTSGLVAMAPGDATLTDTDVPFSSSRKPKEKEYTKLLLAG